MRALVVLFLAAAGVLSTMRQTAAEIREVTAMDKVEFDVLYSKYGKRYGVDPKLLKALAITESSENPNAVNPADPSAGLFQILCVPDGKGGCANQFNIEGWPPPDRQRLFDPDYNTMLAAQIISWNISTYGFKRGIAVFNRWKSRFDPPNGPFGNQSYVDKVLKNFRGL